jgi:membrane protein implicated in regulation of membrane protease activity
MVFGIEIEFWHWWILALLCLGIELFASGFFFVWLAVAAGAVGLLLLAVPETGWRYQLLVFALLSVSSLVAWLRYRRRHPETSDHPTLNRRGESYAGRTFVLQQDIIDGHGQQTLDDSRWKIVAKVDLPAGTKVRVKGADGTVLIVEPVE